MKNKDFIFNKVISRIDESSYYYILHLIRALHKLEKIEEILKWVYANSLEIDQKSSYEEDFKKCL